MNAKTTWSNVKDLTKIQLKQNRYIIYAVLAINTYFALWTPLNPAMSVSSFDPWEINFVDPFAAIVVVMGIFLNIFQPKQEINMFPGTVMSRYYSVLLCRHIIVLVVALSSLWMYILQGAVMVVLSHIYKGFVPESIYSFSYLCYGLIRYLGILLVINGVEILCVALLERFHPVLVYGGAVLCGIIVIRGVFQGSVQNVCPKILRFYEGEGQSFARMMAALLLTWAVCLLLSVILFRTIRAWKTLAHRRISTILVCFLFYSLVLGFTVADTKVDGNQVDVTKFETIVDHWVETTVDVSILPVEERINIGDYGFLCKYSASDDDYYAVDHELMPSMCCSANQAKQYGFDFDASKLDQDHIILLVGSKNLVWDGKDLGERILEAFHNPLTMVTEFDNEAYQYADSDGETEIDYYYSLELSDPSMIAVNASYGNLDTFMPDTTLDGRTWSRVDPWIGHLLYIVIYPDGWLTDINQENE